MKNSSRYALWLLSWVALFFSNGRWLWGPCAWLGPLLLLRLVRTASNKKQLASCYALLVTSTLAQWWGAWGPMRGILLYSGVSAAAIFLFLPYLVDAHHASAQKKWWSTILFPCVWVSTNLLASVAFADVLSLGHSQIHWISLIQIASVTGVFGVTFLLTWFASVVNYLWSNLPLRHTGEGRYPESEFTPARSLDPDLRRGDRHRGNLRQPLIAIILYAVTLSGVLLFGYLRQTSPASASVRVATFEEVSPELQAAIKPLQRAPFHPTEEERNRFRAASREHSDKIWRRIEAESKQGAKLILLSEVSFLLLREDLNGLVVDAKELAAREKIYLALPLGVLDDGQRNLENVLYLIAPNGEMVAYRKSFLTPGEPSIPGDYRMVFLESVYGVLSGAICADFASHWIFSQAGERGASVVFDPASEWDAVDPIQTYITAFRSIEQGFTIVKQTRDGPSVIISPTGEFVTWVDAQDPPQTLRGEAPLAPRKTLYSSLGDVFAYLCLLGAIIIPGMNSRAIKDEASSRLRAR